MTYQLQSSSTGVKRIEVWVRFQQEGWHNWPEAPRERMYLRHSHRHMFWYEVRVVMTWSERDRGLEFHDLLEFCREQVRGTDLGANSCEMLAEALGRTVLRWLDIDQSLGTREVIVTVSEDNECGATIVLQ